MILALILLLQDESFEKLTKAAAAKDESAQKKLLEMGTKAVRPLLERRSKFAGEDLARFDEFLFKLKKSSDPAKDHAELYDRTASIRITVDLQNAPLETFAGYFYEVTGTPVIIDPGLLSQLADQRVLLKLTDTPFWRALDAAVRGAGAEWAVRYGVIVISTPERLWAETPKPARKLTEEEAKEVAALIRQLGSDSIDAREKASARMREIGPGAKDLIVKAADSEKDAEIVARCRDLLREWSPGNDAILSERCGVDLQKLNDEEKETAERLRTDEITFKVKELNLNGALKLLLGTRRLAFDLNAATADVKITADLSNVSFYTALALLTRPYGFDFYLKDGKIVVDTAENVRTAIGK